MVIDEAQNLSAEVLEQIRLLTNLEVTTQKLLQIILIGQPELQTILARPELRQLTQRITARFHLTPLASDEVAAYIRHRLQIVGFKGELFTRSAIHLIHRLSGGVPRLINNICERSMMGAYGENVHRADRNLVRKAAGEVLQPVKRLQPTQWVAGGAIAAGTVALLLSGWGFLPKTSLETYANTNSEIEITESVNPNAEQAIATFSNKVNDERAQNQQITATTSSQKKISAEHNPQTPHRNEHIFEDVINNNNFQSDNTAAFTALFSYWGGSYSQLQGDTACTRALSANLRCIFGKGNWEDIRSYNRPAVIELINTAGKRKQIVVLSLQGNQVRLNIGGEVVTAATNEIDPFWYGNYLLLWKPPPGGSNVLKEGLIGSDVGWLRDQLDRIEGKAVAIDEKKNLQFDPTLKWRVMEFQRIRGLNVDGVVGRETMIEINTAANDRSTPVLWRQTS